MKHTMTALVVILFLLPRLAIGSLFPPAEGDICATIPFEFIVGDKVLPAGDYILRVNDESGLVEICEDGVYCESVVTSPVEAAYAPNTPELAFRKYGNQYFLSQIWLPGHTGRHLPESSVQPNCNDAIRTWEAAFVQARPVCIHKNIELSLAPTWH